MTSNDLKIDLKLPFELGYEYSNQVARSTCTFIWYFRVKNLPYYSPSFIHISSFSREYSYSYGEATKRS